MKSARDKKLDAIGARLGAVKLTAMGKLTARQRRQVERELKSIGKDLAALPPLPTDHLTRHIGAAWSKGVDMAAKKLSAGTDAGRTSKPKPSPAKCRKNERMNHNDS